MLLSTCWVCRQAGDGLKTYVFEHKNLRSKWGRIFKFIPYVQVGLGQGFWKSNLRKLSIQIHSTEASARRLRGNTVCFCLFVCGYSASELTAFILQAFNWFFIVFTLLHKVFYQSGFQRLKWTSSAHFQLLICILWTLLKQLCIIHGSLFFWLGIDVAPHFCVKQAVLGPLD